MHHAHTACGFCVDGKTAYEYNLTNIEYTEFGRLGITDEAVEGAPGAAQLSVYPANTNVLYVGLQAARNIIQQVRECGIKQHSKQCRQLSCQVYSPLSSIGRCFDPLYI